MKLKPIPILVFLLILAGAGVGAYRLRPQGSSKSNGQNPVATNSTNSPTTSATALPVASDLPQVTLKGLIGGEKEGLLSDPDVVKILHDNYNITLNVNKVGSLDMVRGQVEGQDFLWPSSQVALDIFRKRSNVKMLSNEVVLNSPIVVYSWQKTTDNLIKKGIVQKIQSSYYIVDMPKLVELMSKKATWKQLGLEFYGPVVVYSTDPVRSNSGMSFAGLLATMLNGGDVVTPDKVTKVLPTLKTFYARQGYMQSGSAEMFDQFLEMGEGSYPLVVGYESQLVEYGEEHPDRAADLKSQVRILYPKPTVWSSHPLIALTDDSKRLLTAMKDPRILDIAWKKHGFRSGNMTVKQNDHPGVPLRIESVVPMPSGATMERLIADLQAS